MNPLELETLTVSTEDDTAFILLDRPETANAVNRQMLHDLVALADWLYTQDDIHFVVFYNEGETFSSGQDLKELQQEVAEGRNASKASRLRQKLAQEMMRKLEGIEQVTFMAIRGSAYGAGVAIAMTADFRVMANSAIFNLPETQLGRFLTFGSLPRLVSTIGLAKAKQMVMFAEDASAQELHALGLVDYVAEVEDVFNVVQERIERLRQMNYAALRLTKVVAQAAAAPHIGDVMHSEPELVDGFGAANRSLSDLDPFFKGA